MCFSPSGPIPTICPGLQEWAEEPAFSLAWWEILMPRLFNHRPGPTFSFISVEETDLHVCGMSEVAGILREGTQTQCKPPKTGPRLSVT